MTFVTLPDSADGTFYVTADDDSWYARDTNLTLTQATALAAALNVGTRVRCVACDGDGGEWDNVYCDCCQNFVTCKVCGGKGHVAG